MKIHKLQFLLLFSVANSISATVLPHKAVRRVPFDRRDHGNPFLDIPTPQPTTTIAAAAASEAPETNIIPTTVAAPSTPTTLSTLISFTSAAASSSHPTSSAITTTTSSSTVKLSSSTSTHTSTVSTSSILSSSSSTTISPTPTPLAAAPVQTSPIETYNQSSSSSNRTWVIVGIFGLAFGLAGLVIFILTSRRRARKQRARGLKREVELRNVGGMERGEGSTAVSRERGKIETVVILDQEKLMMERKLEMEGEGSGEGKAYGEWEQGLPAYSR